MRLSGPVVSICAVVAVALTVRAAPLSEAEQAEYVDAYIARQNGTETFTADVKQTLQLRGLKRPTESLGRIYYRAPDALALVFTQPANEFLILNGPKAWVKKSRQAVRHQTRPPQGGATLLLSLFQSNAVDYRRLFDIGMERTNEHLRVTLTPKTPDRQMRLRSIENLVTLPALEVQTIHIRFEGDNQMQFEFLNPERNTPINPAIFEVRP